MNAPQFGPAANTEAAPSTSSSLFNFLAAGSTNPAMPDFKTIAASFFAAPATTTTTALLETKATTTSKPFAPFSSHGREDNKEKDAQASLPTFLPTIPLHSFPTLTARAPEHAEPMSSSQPTDAKEGSPAPIRILPVVNKLPDLQQILSSQSTTKVARQNAPSAQKQSEFNDIESPITPTSSAKLQTGNVPATEKTPQVATAPTKSPESASDSKITADSSPFLKTNNVGAAAETTEVAKTKVSAELPTLRETITTAKTQTQTAITANATNIGQAAEDNLNAPSVEANNIDTGLSTAETGAHRTTANAFGQKLSSKIEKTAASTESKKPSPIKQSVEAEKSNATEGKQTSPVEGTDQEPQQQTVVPQSIDEVVQAVAPQAVVLENTVNSHALGDAINLPSTSVKSTGKPGQTESTSAGTNTFATATPEKISPEELNSAKTAPIVEANPKTITSKSKTDTAVKKTQRTSAENQSDATTATTTSHRQEVHAVSSSQDATSKNQDTATPQLNIGSHAKSASTKNTSEAADPVAPSANQIPDTDDIAPPSHAGINTAKLVQGLTQSELRVGLQTRDFGNIDIRTSASRHEFTAQISVEHGEVAHTLTSELPNLYARLNEQQVPVSNIHIHDQSLSTSLGLDQRSQQSSQQSQSSGFTKQQVEPTLPVIPEVFGSTERLDIRV